MGLGFRVAMASSCLSLCRFAIRAMQEAPFFCVVETHLNVFFFPDLFLVQDAYHTYQNLSEQGACVTCFFCSF